MKYPTLIGTMHIKSNFKILRSVRKNSNINYRVELLTLVVYNYYNVNNI